MGHDDLKVGGNLSVEGYAKVEHHLEVNGHLDFGQKTATLDPSKECDNEQMSCTFFLFDGNRLCSRR